MLNPEQALIKKRTFEDEKLSPIEGRAKRIIEDDQDIKTNASRKERFFDMNERAKAYKESDKKFGGKVEQDKELVRKKRKEDQPKSLRGELLEDIFEKYSKEMEWFGDNARVVNASEYDDRVNHTDFIVLFGSGEKLAIDCTVSEDDYNLSQKYRYVLDGIKNRKLTEIKYIDTEKNGPIDLVPRAVVGLRRNQLASLCGAILEGKISGHYMQLFILMNIEKQLSFQLEYASKENGYATWKTFQKDKKETDRKRISAMEEKIYQTTKVIRESIENKKSSLGSEAVLRAENDLEKSNPQKFLED
jgi:hypothetical protein